MKYYIEITILPSPEIGPFFLWERLFQKLHIALVEMKESTGKVSIGVGFPKYRPSHSLGDKLRLFGQSKEELESLYIENQLKGFKDYLHIKSIQNVPNNIDSFCCFKRQPIKTNRECLARRKVKRHKVTYEQAIEDYKDFKPKFRKIPYILINSASNGGRFPLFIQKEKKDNQVFKGFSTYGLNRISTVPDFE